MSSDHEAMARGLHAASELTETEGAFDAVEAAIFAKFRNTPITQPDTVLKLHMAAQNLAAVRKALQDTIANGRVAESYVQAADVALSSQITSPN
jgi:hypothetical protein